MAPPAPPLPRRALLRAARGRQRGRQPREGGGRRCHSDAAAAMAAAGPAPLLPAEAEALVRALQGTELRDAGGQGCGGTALLGRGPGGGGRRFWGVPGASGPGGGGGSMKKGL